MDGLTASTLWLVPPAWPEDDYLLLLGKLVYSVAALEGLLIFDLPRCPDGGLKPSDLASMTTTGVGNRLVAYAAQVRDPQWRRYLSEGGGALQNIGPMRNSVLHARPATIDGQQRLHRWELSRPEVFSVTVEHLEELLGKIDRHRSRLQTLRPPLDR